MERSQAGQGTTVSEQALFDVFKKPRKMGKGKTATLTEEQRCRILRRVSLGEFTRMESVAAMVLFLLGEGAASITGQDMVVDAGSL